MDDTPSAATRRFQRLDGTELARVGDALMRAYADALAVLNASEAEYRAWRTEMARRKP